MSTSKLQPVTDANALEPFRDLLGDLPVEGDTLVRAIVPGDHEDYARILHPAQQHIGGEVRQVRWSEIASSTGARLDAETPFRRITVPPGTSVPRGPQGAWEDQGCPDDGNLSEEDCLILVNLLAPFTSTSCRFLIWDGWPGLRLDPAQVLVTWRGNPHLVSRGPHPASAQFVWSGTWQVPHLWFPEDRAWCVGTDIDGDSTYVAGPERLVSGLLGIQDIEVIRTHADAVAIRNGEWLTT
jgi:hypothetical protein